MGNYELGEDMAVLKFPRALFEEAVTRLDRKRNNNNNNSNNKNKRKVKRHPSPLSTTKTEVINEITEVIKTNIETDIEKDIKTDTPEITDIKDEPTITKETEEEEEAKIIKKPSKHYHIPTKDIHTETKEIIKEEEEEEEEEEEQVKEEKEQEKEKEEEIEITKTLKHYHIPTKTQKHYHIPSLPSLSPSSPQPFFHESENNNNNDNNDNTTADINNNNKNVEIFNTNVNNNNLISNNSGQIKEQPIQCVPTNPNNYQQTDEKSRPLRESKKRFYELLSSVIAKDPCPSHFDTHVNTLSATKSKLLNKQLKRDIIQSMSRVSHFPAEILSIEGKGTGIKTLRALSRYQFICEYRGELITKTEALRREKMYTATSTTRIMSCYMYYFEHRGQEMCLDATTENGPWGIGRLINHSINGNVDTIKIVVEGVPRLVFIANRDIEAGDELAYDYGDRTSTVAFPWLKK